MARSKKNSKNGTSAANDAPKRSRRRSSEDSFEPEDHAALGGEQGLIPGTETEENKEIETAAKDLDKAKKNYAAWGRSASVLNERLVGLMRSAGHEHYWRNGVEVNIKATDPKEKADVTIERG